MYLRAPCQAGLTPCALKGSPFPAGAHRPSPAPWCSEGKSTAHDGGPQPAGRGIPAFSPSVDSVLASRALFPPAPPASLTLQRPASLDAAHTRDRTVLVSPCPAHPTSSLQFRACHCPDKRPSSLYCSRTPLCACPTSSLATHQEVDTSSQLSEGLHTASTAAVQVYAPSDV